MIKFFYTLIVACCFYSSSLLAQELNDLKYAVNGEVYDMCRKGNRLYIGGTFGMLIKKTGCAALIDVPTNKVNYNFPVIDGTVQVIKSDGTGGWYIGGSFKHVGDSLRNNLVHINADFSIDAWNPNPSSTVSDLIVTGTRLIVAGSFTSIAGNVRNRLASFTLSTKVLESWNPNANSWVGSIEAVGSTLYAGGSFTALGGQTRTCLASCDLNTGAVSSWSPAISSGLINDIMSFNNQLYIGGTFLTINSMSRPYVASFTISNGNLSTWNPTPNSYVTSLFGQNNNIYMSGYFDKIGTESTPYAACVDITGSLYTYWKPSNPGYANKIEGYQGEIMVGGKLYDDLNGTLLAPYNATPNSTVFTIAVSDNKVVLGGSFNAAGPQLTRTCLAEFDLTTGELTDWAPELINGSVTTIALHGDTLYAAGYFTAIYLQPRNYFGGISTTTGQVSAWRPLFNNTINKIIIKNNTLYVGGLFTGVGTDTRNRLAAFDLISKNLLPLNPNFDGTVIAMDVEKNMLYAGGTFYSAGGLSRSKFAAIDLTTQAVTSFAPSFDDNVFAIDAIGDKVYVGGRFTTIDAVTRKRAARFNASSGTLDAWNPNLDNFILGLAVKKQTVYMGGIFTTVGGIARIKFAAVDTLTGLVQPFNPVQAEVVSVRNIVADDDFLFVGMNAVNTLVLGKQATGICAFTKFPDYFNNITGKVITDENLNCSYQNTDQYYLGMLVQALPGPVYGISDSNGVYNIPVEAGNYKVNQIIQRKKTDIITPVCPNSPGYYQLDMTQLYKTSTGNDFYNEQTDCAYLVIDIGSNRRRACFKGLTIAKYCNVGGGPSTAGEVVIEYSKRLYSLSSYPAWNTKDSGKLTYTIPALQQGECGSIILIDSVECINAIGGEVACIKASIYPKNNCVVANNSWDGSDIEVNAVCDQNDIVFKLKNTGTGDMADSSVFKVYYDGVIGYTHNYKILASGELRVTVPGNGKTVRLEAQQRPYYPFYDKASATQEACGGSGAPSRGFSLALPNDDYNSSVSYSCMNITKAFDPNEKAVIPSGVTDDHYVQPNEMLHYTVHFQNTGNDTATTVVLVDTLDSDLDISSLEIGVASHPYKLSVSGHGNPVLTWTFNDINLPDSTVDYQGSMGYVKFSISQMPDNPNGTLLKNKSYIYFDYNEAIITNETSLMVQDNLPEDQSLGANVIVGGIATGVSSSQVNSKVNVYPNPFSSTVYFELPGSSTNKVKLSILNTDGTKLFEEMFIGNKYILDKKFSSGLYLYKLEEDNGTVHWGKIVAM